MAKEYLLVDGYNIIFAWEDLRDLADDNLEAARVKLADILCNYQGFKKNEVILVFDGHKFRGNPGSIYHYNNIDIVYTKEAISADQFIETVVQQMGRSYNIRVATSDALEQVIILGKGATRVTARELKAEIRAVEKSIEETYKKKVSNKRNSLIDNLSDEMAELLEKMRLDDSK
ncbi:putative RNA-binding protein with PIN domain [Mobilisporobacter senegalensis]|uniref:Putative RNA-binding protein with PIN domain n=1 Tax=Mobilisporobacter senegalensis TaxID=1329262 RepID=A0A3N1XHV3_9FIRM|nr:NYN domain-containing protein [Mobilisporobacter senegalensis]ROR26289.1 putative RNA-binding protein with PIN domain [Mobilisporobacter senegalensis]